MTFIPAGLLLGPNTPTRTVILGPGSNLPAGEYVFQPHFCTDPGCDCRKAMIHVFYNGTVVSLINFGWESIAYYERWFGQSPLDQDILDSMKGPAIDIQSPNKIPPKHILDFFKAVILNEEFRLMICDQYTAFRAKIEKDPKLVKRIIEKEDMYSALQKNWKNN